MTDEESELLFNALNEQGFLFQQACELALKKAERSTGWEVRASDYPVSLQKDDTKVDIVLHSKTSSSPELYALVECKRADPSFIYWLFGAPGLPFEDALCSTAGLECRGTRSDQPYQVDPLLTQLHFRVSTYGAMNWVEVKKDSAKKGSAKRVSSPQNIEDAFFQVLKGVGGFAQEHLAQRQKSRAVFKTFFVPIVITTAPLYVAAYEPRDISLSVGKISKDKVLFGPRGHPAQRENWVLVDYGVGENLAPKPIPDNYHGVDLAELQKHKTRSIFVVNSNSIVTFFSRLSLAVES